MTILEKYWDQLHLDQIGVTLISKTVALINLFILFLILKRVAEFFFNKMVVKSLALTTQSDARKRPSQDYYTTVSTTRFISF